MHQLHEGAEQDAWVHTPSRPLPWVQMPAGPSAGGAPAWRPPPAASLESSSSSSLDSSLPSLEWCHRKCLVQQQMEAASYRKARASYAKAKAAVYPPPAKSQRLHTGAAAKQSGKACRWPAACAVLHWGSVALGSTAGARGRTAALVSSRHCNSNLVAVPLLVYSTTLLNIKSNADLPPLPRKRPCRVQPAMVCPTGLWSRCVSCQNAARLAL